MIVNNFFRLRRSEVVLKADSDSYGKLCSTSNDNWDLVNSWDTEWPHYPMYVSGVDAVIYIINNSTPSAWTGGHRLCRLVYCNARARHATKSCNFNAKLCCSTTLSIGNSQFSFGKQSSNKHGFYTVSQKKTSKIIFVITTTNFHQIWQFLAQRWQKNLWGVLIFHLI